jgi:hypothetical protein
MKRACSTPCWHAPNKENLSYRDLSRVWRVVNLTLKLSR